MVRQHRQVRDPAAARGHHRRASTPLGLTRADVDFTCLGSCDYITGQAFSFVQNLDAIGAWPPKRDSHVEMDGAWALYEAWLRLQQGDIDDRGGHGLGPLVDRRPGAHLPDGDGPVLPRPARRRPADVRRAAGPGADRRRHRRRAADGRGRGPLPRDAKGNPHAQVTGDFDVDELLAERLRARAAAPPRPAADHRRRRRDGARHAPTGPASCASGRRGSPASTTAPSATTRRSATSTDSPSTRIAGEGGRARRRRRSRWPSCRPRSPTRSCCCVEVARPRRRRRGQPVGRRARGEPDHGHRPRAASATPPTTSSTAAAPHARPLDVGPVPATEPRLHPGGRLVSHQPCAIVGVGQTHHKSRRLRRVASAASSARPPSGRSTTPR